MVHKSNEYPVIYLNEYLLLGWTRGYTNEIRNRLSQTHKNISHNHCIGKKTIHMGDKMKKVPESELQKYLDEGWKLGQF